MIFELPIKHQNTKTLNIKNNGRSSHFVTPNYILGCNAGCSSSYCYTRRFGRKHIFVNTNWKEINQKVLEHSLKLAEVTPSQIDDTYWVYDICCDTDLIRHWNDTDWESILQFYNETPKIKATFATKFTSSKLYNIKPIDNKLRIRFSLIPQELSEKLEPHTAKVRMKLDSAERLKSLGWDVHFNFSPVIFCENWLNYYRELFEQIKERGFELPCEVIFLTHNEFKHNENIVNQFPYEDLLWKPEFQEEKHSEYGGINLRYKWELKNHIIEDFKKLYSEYFDLKTIRYIF